MPAPLLVVGVGNPSRGDDALGPLFVERAAEVLATEVAAGDVEFLTDFQLQIEHALDLVGRARVVFVDASVRAAAPFEFTPVAARREMTHSTHAMSPAAVLDVYRSTLGQPPAAWALAIRGERFELGDALSDAARAHLDAALAAFVAREREATEPVTRRIELEGTVQGVGLRPWVCRLACELGLDGAVRNTARGARIDVRGPQRALAALLAALQRDAPPAARVRSLRVTELAPDALPVGDGFTIAPSELDGDAALSLPPDLALCGDCTRELDDPANRRHGYAFVTCARCGPRFSLARELPYDRAATTMDAFTPCATCRREYDDVDDRRFHAQTVACAACGPRVWLADATGAELASADPVAKAAARLRAGEILAVQGLGAFHLVCDATDARAVAELRRRKRRDTQPFAVMVADEAAADALALLDDVAREALRSPARPIVLAPSRDGALPPAVNGPSQRTGLLLPYTPLHHLLVARVGQPLVVTSGNPSGGPAAITHDEALTALASIADVFVLHDRPIARRVEDSVVDARGPTILRRARGFAPTPIRLPFASREPIVAVGGHQKNTACVVVGDLAYLTPHLGDLGTEESEHAWARELDGFERLLGVRPAVVAHDLHPDYATTRHAVSRKASRCVGVQHHAAHVWAAIAELHLDEPVVGVAFDGTGWGPDGTSWGGEILLVDGARWRRVASLRPLALPGGERAIREVWRPALAALVDAFGRDEGLALSQRFRAFDDVPEASRATVARMIASGVSTPRAHGLGRWFDALGALALGVSRAGFDGHVAIALEECADPAETHTWPVAPPELSLDGDFGEAHEVDLRPAVRSAVNELLAGVAAGAVAARFHDTVVAVTAATVARALAVTGLRRVVLSGGCMQNRLLSNGLTRRLGEGRVAMAREVPVNDGGLSLGQAWAAALSLEEA
ncbi:MAG: carbamoyltransferase HypF [Polyangiales bacterium]